MVSSELKIFDSIICTREDFLDYRKYGVYVFKFFKNGKQFYVIVDDRIPCLEKPDN